MIDDRCFCVFCVLILDTIFFSPRKCRAEVMGLEHVEKQGEEKEGEKRKKKE